MSQENSELVNDTPILRLTKHTLDQIASSKNNSLQVTLGDDEYTLTVQKTRRKTT